MTMRRRVSPTSWARRRRSGPSVSKSLSICALSACRGIPLTRAKFLHVLGVVNGEHAHGQTAGRGRAARASSSAFHRFIRTERYTSIFPTAQPMTAISFEFFPPKTDEQREQLERSVQKLKQRGPEYV